MQRLHLTQSAQLRLAWALLIALTLGYTLWMSSLTVLRYTSFIATAFDLGNMDQVIWNTLHGHLFQWTNQSDNYFGPPIRLAQHVEPIILPLSLLYLIYPDPRTLLLFQTFVLASGTLPVFLLARRYLPSWPLFAPIMVAAYLFSPALLGENLYDFHPVSLATPLILYAFLALAYRRYGWFLAACVLAITTKEDVPFTMALFGLLLIWKYKLPKPGSALAIIGLLWFSLAFFIVMPHFLGAKNNNFWYRYADLGPTPLAALQNILLHPWILFSYFITLSRIYYLFGLFRSTGFLALFAPEWLLPILFSLAVNLLSADGTLYSGIYQYNATIIPFIIIAAIHGMQRILLCWQQWQGEEIGVPAVGLLDLAGSHPASQSTRLPSYALFLLKRGDEALRAIFDSRPVVRVRPHMAAIVQSGKALRWSFNEQMTALAQVISAQRFQWYASLWLIAMIALNWIIMVPELNYIWPLQGVTDRDRNIEQLLTEIPANAAVSAGTNINPHVTERQYVTVFPAIEVATMQKTYVMVDYVIVDLNAVFPEDRNTTAVMLTRLMQSGQFCLIKQADGVILLKRCGP